MHETNEDLERLQRVLDESHGVGGSHLTGILQEERRLTAQDFAAMMTGVQVLSLATVTKDCRPLVGGVDGLFYRGTWHFGTAPNAIRAKHLARNAAVSATHLRGEELAIVVHGYAVPLDVYADPPPGFRSYLLEVYPGWESWYGKGGAAYWRIEPRKMFAARLPGASA